MSSMNRLTSRSVPHLPRYQSVSPARLPRLDSRRFASVQSMTSYIDGEPSRTIYSYHSRQSPSPSRAYRVHHIPLKSGSHLVRYSRSLSQSDIRSSHVYTPLNELSTRALQGRDDRVKMTSCEDVRHRRKPFFPDLNTSESDVSTEGWGEERSRFGGREEDNSSSQHSFAGSDVTLESELDNDGHFEGFREYDPSDSQKSSRRVVRRSSGDFSSTDSNCSSPVTSYAESKRRELTLKEFEKTRIAGLKVHIPSDDRSQSSDPRAVSSRPLAQSTPHVSPREKHESRLSVKASWTVDDDMTDETFLEDRAGSRLPAFSRSPFDVDMSDSDLQSLSRFGESSLNTSFSEDSLSDVSVSTVSTAGVKGETTCPGRRSQEKSKSCENMASTAYDFLNLETLDQDDCGYGTDHYHSQADLLDHRAQSRDIWSAVGTVNKAVAVNESWAFLSIGSGDPGQSVEESYVTKHDATKVLTPGLLKIPLITAGKQGQEKLRRVSQSSPPFDQPAPDFTKTSASAFHSWSAAIDDDTDMDTGQTKHGVTDNVQRAEVLWGRASSADTSQAAEEDTRVNGVTVRGSASVTTSDQGVTTSDQGVSCDSPSTQGDINEQNDSGLSLLDDSRVESSCRVEEHLDRHGGSNIMSVGSKPADVTDSTLRDKSVFGVSTLHECVEDKLDLVVELNLDSTMNADLASTALTCSPCDDSTHPGFDPISRHFLKTERGNFPVDNAREIHRGQDDASTCDGVTSARGEWWPSGDGDVLNSCDSPMNAGLAPRQLVDGAIIDHVQMSSSNISSNWDKERPEPRSNTGTENTHTPLPSSPPSVSSSVGGEVPLISLRVDNDCNALNFHNLEVKNRQETGFDSPALLSVDCYSSPTESAHVHSRDNAVKYLTRPDNKPTEITSRDNVNRDSVKDGCVTNTATRDAGVIDYLQAGEKETRVLDTGVGQQGGIGEISCHVSMPVVEEGSIKEGSEARHREFRRCEEEEKENCTEDNIQSDQSVQRAGGVFCFNKFQELIDSEHSVLYCDSVGTSVLVGCTSSVITDVKQTSVSLITERCVPSDTHMACTTRGGDEGARGTKGTGGNASLCDDSTPQSSGAFDTGGGTSPVSSERRTSGVLIAGGAEENEDRCVGGADRSPADSVSTVTSEMTSVASNEKLLENLHAQLFRISSYEDEDSADLNSGVYTDCAKATSAAQVEEEDNNEDTIFLVDDVEGMATYYSYSIDVHDPETSPDVVESVEREHYDNDDGIIGDSRTYTYRRHFPASLVKPGHIKSSSLWTLQEETESLIDAQSPRSSPKRLIFGVASEEENSSSNSSRPHSPIGDLSSSEERIADIVVNLTTSTSDRESDVWLDSVMLKADVTDIANLGVLPDGHHGRQARETSFCGPFPPVDAASCGKSPLDILSDSLEQFQRDVADDQLLPLQSNIGLGPCSDHHSWADEPASETSSRLHDFDNELSFISSSVSPSPSDFSDGSVYTCTDTAQVKTSRAPYFDYDVLVSPSDNSAMTSSARVESPDSSSVLEETKHALGEEFEKLLEEFSAITSPLADLDEVTLVSVKQFENLYKEFTGDHSEKKQNHTCIVVEEESMDSYRFKRFLKKSHTKRKRGKKLLRFLTSLGCVSESAHSPETSPKKVWGTGEQTFSMNNMVSVTPKPARVDTFQHHVVLARNFTNPPPRGNSPTSSSHSLDSVKSRADSAYSSFSESLTGDLTGLTGPHLHQHAHPKFSGSVSSVFGDGPLTLNDSAYIPTPDFSTRTFSEAEMTSNQKPGGVGVDSDVLCSLADVFEQLNVCEEEIDSALLKRLRHGHNPAHASTK